MVALAAMVALSQLSGCGGTGGTAATGAGTGTVQVGLTDAQSDNFQQVIVSIKEVRLVPAGLENAADNDPGLPVVVTYATPRTVDVLTLKFQQELLGTITVPAGRYNQVRLILADNPGGQSGTPVNYLTLKSAPAVKIPLNTPSGQQSGLKVLGRFDVNAGNTNVIVIDFDPNTAIVQKGNNTYNFKPTGIRIIQSSSMLANFGSLTGRVVSTFRDFSSATVSVVPQGGISPVASSTVFSNLSGSRWAGPYSTFVPGGSYRVHIQAKGFASYSSPVRTVTTGAETALGDALLAPLAP